MGILSTISLDRIDRAKQFVFLRAAAKDLKDAMFFQFDVVVQFPREYQSGKRELLALVILKNSIFKENKIGHIVPFSKVKEFALESNMLHVFMRGYSMRRNGGKEGTYPSTFH